MLLSDDVVRFVLPALCILQFCSTILLRAWLTRRRTGVNPLALTSTDDVYGYLKTTSFLLTLGVAGLLAFYAIRPDLMVVLAPLVWLESVWVRAVGLALLSISIVFVCVAQSDLGTSWRIGIDKTAPTELREDGLYRWSRNPIFLGLRLSMLGIFLVIPNAVSLAFLLLNEVILEAEVRCEEAFSRIDTALPSAIIADACVAGFEDGWQAKRASCP